MNNNKILFITIDNKKFYLNTNYIPKKSYLELLLNKNMQSKKTNDMIFIDRISDDFKKIIKIILYGYEKYLDEICKCESLQADLYYLRILRKEDENKLCEIIKWRNKLKKGLIIEKDLGEIKFCKNNVCHCVYRKSNEYLSKFDLNLQEEFLKIQQKTLDNNNIFYADVYSETIENKLLLKIIVNLKKYKHEKFNMSIKRSMYDFTIIKNDQVQIRIYMIYYRNKKLRHHLMLN